MHSGQWENPSTPPSWLLPLILICCLIYLVGQFTDWFLERKERQYRVTSMEDFNKRHYYDRFDPDLNMPYSSPV